MAPRSSLANVEEEIPALELKSSCVRPFVLRSLAMVLPKLRLLPSF